MHFPYCLGQNESELFVFVAVSILPIQAVLRQYSPNRTRFGQCLLLMVSEACSKQTMSLLSCTVFSLIPSSPGELGVPLAKQP